jgi:hypothetical protein
MNAAWEGEILALQVGHRYIVRADFVPDSEAEVLVRSSSEQPFAVPKPIKPPPIKTRLLTPESPQFIFTADTNMALMQLVLRTAGQPTNLVRSVALRPIAE